VRIRLIKENRYISAVIIVGKHMANYTSLIRCAQETESVLLQYREGSVTSNVNLVSTYATYRRSETEWLYSSFGINV